MSFEIDKMSNVSWEVYVRLSLRSDRIELCKSIIFCNFTIAYLIKNCLAR